MIIKKLKARNMEIYKTNSIDKNNKYYKSQSKQTNFKKKIFILKRKISNLPKNFNKKIQKYKMFAKKSKRFI